jgi:hypothetical protein
MNNEGLSRRNLSAEEVSPSDEEQWLNRESINSSFRDVRIAKRFRALLNRL